MDKVNTYKCPCCSAPLIFKKDKLCCKSCDNEFAVELMQQMTEGMAAAGGKSKYNWDKYEPRNFDDTNEVDLSDYNCPSCGAEIMGDDTLGSTVCPYCGQSTVVKKQFEGALRPDYIIPFKIDKEKAVAAFEADMKNAPFLPNEFKDKKKIQEMSGVYVPFWMFDCDCDAAITYNAQTVTTWSDSTYRYTKTDHFRLFRSGTIGFANIPVDGSKKADDAYMEALEPYNYEEAIDFSGEYLSGYMADRYDVSAENSIKRANERVKNSAVSIFRDTAGQYTSVEEENTNISFSNGKIRYSLLPVWMLNIKYLDKIYRFAVNGQTGKVVGDYPVDKRKKWWYFAKVASIAFVLLSLGYYLIFC